MQLATGMMVTPNVRLLQPIGEGAMGCVWAADHLTLKTKVAVKFISADLAADAMVMQRFAAEASTAAQIKSPHVIQTFDQGVMSDGTPYIVMEMLDGETLMERLDRAGWLSLEDAAHVIGQVARALGNAHDKGIVHRDIKPDNIFITYTADGPFCKLLDFGIAKQTQLPKMGGVTSAGVMVGTPEYMSPEQVLSSRDVDYRADLWGLAVTMYHALTSNLPFTAEALGTLCVKLLDGKFTPVTALRRDLPAELDGFFDKALAHDATARFADAREMASRFVELVQKSPGFRSASKMDEPTPFPIAPVSGRVVLPAQARTAIDSAPPLQHSAKSETFGGSSSSHSAEPRKMPWLAASVAGAVGVVAIVAIVAVVGGDDEEAPSAPASTAEPSDVARPEPVDEPPAEAEAETDASESPEPLPASSAGATTPAASSATRTSTPSATTSAGAASPKIAPPKPKSKSKHYNHGF